LIGANWSVETWMWWALFSIIIAILSGLSIRLGDNFKYQVIVQIFLWSCVIFSFFWEASDPGYVNYIKWEWYTQVEMIGRFFILPWAFFSRNAKRGTLHGDIDEDFLKEINNFKVGLAWVFMFLADIFVRIVINYIIFIIPDGELSAAEIALIIPSEGEIFGSIIMLLIFAILVIQLANEDNMTRVIVCFILLIFPAIMYHPIMFIQYFALSYCFGSEISGIVIHIIHKATVPE